MAYICAILFPHILWFNIFLDDCLTITIYKIHSLKDFIHRYENNKNKFFLIYKYFSKKKSLINITRHDLLYIIIMPLFTLDYVD